VTGGAQPPPPGGGTARRRLGLRSAVAVVFGVVSALGVVAGLADDSLSVVDRFRQDAGDSHASPVPPGPGTTAPPDPGVPAVTAGTCLAEDLTPVPCTVSHARQVVPVTAGECGVAGLVGHMGGRADTDVVLLRVQVAAGPDGEPTCTATTRDGSALTESLAGALGRPGHARYRWCVDTRAAADVPCDVEHDGEYVGAATSAPTAQECTVAVERYLDASYRRHADRLRLTVTPTAPGTSTRPACLLATRGSARLVDSLRELRARALPVA